MVTKRRKKRTHVKVAGDAGVTAGNAVPKSFIIHSGSVSKPLRQLETDLRKLMEPNTASRLRERHRNKLKDFQSMAGPLGVSHLLTLSQTDRSTSLRIGKLPQGPTACFRVDSYSLMRDVAGTLKKPRSATGVEFQTVPLLVLNNFPVERAEGKLLCSLLQHMFPTINTSKVDLGQVRRIALFHYESPDCVQVRHFYIDVKSVGISKSVKRILRSQIPDMSNFADAAEYVLKAEANLSDSEVEADSVISWEQEEKEKKEGKAKKPKESTDSTGMKSATMPSAAQKAINLVECGPRLTLKLIKIVEGLHSGKILYHSESSTDDKEMV